MGGNSKINMPLVVAIFCGIMTIIGIVLVGLYPSKFIFICELIQEWNPLNWLICTIVIIVWILLCLPSTTIEVASGFIFGLFGSFLVTIIAKTIASYLAFCIGEYFGGKKLKQKME